LPLRFFNTKIPFILQIAEKYHNNTLKTRQIGMNRNPPNVFPKTKGQLWRRKELPSAIERKGGNSLISILFWWLRNCRLMHLAGGPLTGRQTEPPGERR
jgi:hypothetical protein